VKVRELPLSNDSIFWRGTSFSASLDLIHGLPFDRVQAKKENMCSLHKSCPILWRLVRPLHISRLWCHHCGTETRPVKSMQMVLFDRHVHFFPYFFLHLHFYYMFVKNYCSFTFFLCLCATNELYVDSNKSCHQGFN
jgi:hypothetical protein